MLAADAAEVHESDDAYRGTFEEAFESLRKRGVVSPSAESAARDRMRACFNHDAACVLPAVAPTLVLTLR